MTTVDEPIAISWLVVCAPLIGVVLLTGLGYLIGYLTVWWRSK